MKRKNKKLPFKKILKTIPVIAGVMAVFYVGVLIKDIEIPMLLPVTDVQVQGELNFIDAEEIKTLVKDNVSGGYFTVDLKNIRELLLKKPWIKDISLRRKWPASLNVFIEEQVPVAYWNNAAYLNENGDVFSPASIDESLNLPSLNGPAGQHNNIWQFMNTLYRETALLNYEVVRLDLDSRRAWRMIVIEQDAVNENQIDIRLGRFDTEKRMQRFVRILPALTTQKDLAENRIKVIDMRYPNGFAVKIAAEKAADGSIKNNNNKFKTLSRNLKRLLDGSALQVSEA